MRNVAITRPLFGLSLSCGTQSHLQPVHASELMPAETLQRFASLDSVPEMSASQLASWIHHAGASTFDAWLTTETQQRFEELHTACPDKQLLLRDLEQPQRYFDGQWPATDRMSAVLDMRRPAQPSLSQLLRFDERINADAIPARQAVLVGQNASDSMPAPLICGQDLAADVTQIVDHLNPHVLIVSIAADSIGLSPDARTKLRQFSASPTETQTIASADPSEQTVRFELSRTTDHALITLINRAPWPCEVSFESSEATNWASFHDESAVPQSKFAAVTQGRRTRVLVAAGDGLVLKSNPGTAHVQIRTWSVRMAGGPESAEMVKQDVTAIVERLATLSDLTTYPALSNGGFERAGGVGVTDWL